MPPSKDKPTLQQIEEVYHLPLSEACKKLNICKTLLKQCCRQYNIARWPYKKTKSATTTATTSTNKPTKQRSLFFKNHFTQIQSIPMFSKETNGIIPTFTLVPILYPQKTISNDRIILPKSIIKTEEQQNIIQEPMFNLPTAHQQSTQKSILPSFSLLIQSIENI